MEIENLLKLPSLLSHVWHHFLSNLFFARIFVSVDKITHFFPFSRKEKHHQIEQLSKHLRYFEIDTGNSKSDLKIKEASHINCRITTKLSSHPFTTSSVPPCFFLSFFVVLFCFYISLSSIIFIISDTNYLHLLLSSLPFTIT